MPGRNSSSSTNGQTAFWLPSIKFPTPTTDEEINCCAEALQEQDIFGNSLLKQGDLVIMDNCGFHHARHVEPLLRTVPKPFIFTNPIASTNIQAGSSAFRLG